MKLEQKAKTPHELNCKFHQELLTRTLINAPTTTIGLYTWGDSNIKNEDLKRTRQGVPTTAQDTQLKREKLNHIGNYAVDLFRPVFATHWTELAARIGQKFTVVERQKSYWSLVYLVRFEDGVELHAWPSEVCMPILRQRAGKGK